MIWYLLKYTSNAFQLVYFFILTFEKDDTIFVLRSRCLVVRIIIYFVVGKCKCLNGQNVNKIGRSESYELNSLSLRNIEHEGFNFIRINCDQ